MNEVFIIAEVGSNHDGKFEQALKMILVAKEADCDAVKFQLFKSDKLYSKNTPDFANYHRIPELMKSLELPREWIPSLKKYCDGIGIEFLCSPFDEEAVDLLVNVGVKRIKVAGFESSDLRFLNYVASKGLPMVVSIGANVPDYLLGNIIDIVKKSNENTLSKHYFLHVTQAYPTPINECSLYEMNRIRSCARYPAQFLSNYPINVGYSDHTEGILLPPVAVALGATCIEKHFTLSRDMIGPDHKFAIEPNELKEMVKNIRLVEQSLTVREGLINPCEKEFVKAKRSVVAFVDIPKGQPLSSIEETEFQGNITTKRPFLEGCIPTHEFYNILGKKVNRDIMKDELLKWNDIL